jgi:hypothetical protein
VIVECRVDVPPVGSVSCARIEHSFPRVPSIYDACRISLRRTKPWRVARRRWHNKRCHEADVGQVNEIADHRGAPPIPGASRDDHERGRATRFWRRSPDWHRAQRVGMADAPLVPVRGCRTIGKRYGVLNNVLPTTSVNPIRMRFARTVSSSQPAGGCAAAHATKSCLSRDRNAYRKQPETQ